MGAICSSYIWALNDREYRTLLCTHEYSMSSIVKTRRDTRDPVPVVVKIGKFSHDPILGTVSNATELSGL